jgi:hypothetical protein
VALNGLSPWQGNPYRGFEIVKMARRAAAPIAVPDRCSLRRHVGASLTVIGWHGMRCADEKPPKTHNSCG